MVQVGVHRGKGAQSNFIQDKTCFRRLNDLLLERWDSCLMQGKDVPNTGEGGTNERGKSLVVH